ncbi:hypothetical protein JTB14_029979 [Gonioctena quinquepunctata]|nr:hypothetical protein JTB14_029979 [Gonioctena quinquepunctata]
MSGIPGDKSTVKRCCGTGPGWRNYQQKSKALSRILAKSITKAVARSMKYRMLMKTTLSSQYEFKYKGTQSAIEKLIPISEEMSQIER